MRGSVATILAAAMLLAGCTAVIDQSSFFPASAEPPQAVLRAPPGYVLEEAMLDLTGLGRMHVVRLDNPASNTTIIYHGGNGNFVAAQTERAAALAGASGTDLILYDYPGRGGTNVPATIDASLATGPAMLEQLRRLRWIGSGPLFAYGLSFGGSQAAAMVRNGGFSGLIIEGSASDIQAVGRNFIPRLVKPFVRLKVDPALGRFDYLGYATASRTPVLLLSSADDEIVRVRNMRAFADQLKQRGTQVEMVVVPGQHGTALTQPAALSAVRDFVSKQSRPRG
jgi:pimeloyl-ACP methyl ester carboxylesterase